MISQRSMFKASLQPKERYSPGFSLIEVLIIVMIMGILAAIAIPNYAAQVRDHRLMEYAGEVEYLVKYARIYAMEKTTNVGICRSGNNVSLRDITTSRTAGACTGTQVMGVIVDGSLTVNGLSVGVAVDPRGLVIGSAGGVCLSNGTKYRKIWIEMTGVRIEEGSGGCT